MWTWAEKWQRSFNVTKCKKTYSGEMILSVDHEVFNYNPVKEPKMTENCFLKTSACERSQTKHKNIQKLKGEKML